MESLFLSNIKATFINVKFLALVGCRLKYDNNFCYDHNMFLIRYRKRVRHRGEQVLTEIVLQISSNEHNKCKIKMFFIYIKSSSLYTSQSKLNI